MEKKLIFDTKFLDKLTLMAKQNSRKRMNYNLHDALDAKAQRLYNALEPGTILPVHRHVNTAETFVLIRGKLIVTLLDNNKNVIEIADLDLNNGKFGVQIPANTWHKVEVKESGTVILEIKDGPYTPITPENVME